MLFFVEIFGELVMGMVVDLFALQFLPEPKMIRKKCIAPERK